MRGAEELPHCKAGSAAAPHFRVWTRRSSRVQALPIARRAIAMRDSRKRRWRHARRLVFVRSGRVFADPRGAPINGEEVAGPGPPLPLQDSSSPTRIGWCRRFTSSMRPLSLPSGSSRPRGTSLSGGPRCGLTCTSSTFKPGSTWELRATPANGGSRVDVIGVRHLRGFKGRLLAPFFPLGLVKRTVADHLRHFLSKVEEQE